MTFFFPFVLSSLTEGSLSLAGSLCEQDAAEQTSLILPSIEGALINPGNPWRAARVFLGTRRSLPLGTAAGPASPATERSQPAPMRFPAGAASCARGVPSQAASAAAPPVPYVQPCKNPTGSGASSCPGASCVPSARRRAKRRSSGPWGAAQRVAFWMSSSTKKHSSFFFFYFLF